MNSNEQTLVDLCPEVKKLCEPLTNYLSIVFFRYLRSYKDDTKFCLSTDAAWLEAYYNEKIYNMEFASYHLIPENAKGISMHGACIDQNPVCKFWTNNAFNTGYNFVVATYEKNSEFFELYDFGFKIDSHGSTNVFLNNHSIFRQFKLYFNDAGSEIIKTAVKNRVKVTPDTRFTEKDNWLLPIPKDLQKNVLENLRVEKIYLGRGVHKKYLTRNEVILLKYLAKGMDEKEISEKIGVDENVLSQHLNNIMQKLEVDSRAGLLKATLAEPLKEQLKSFYL